MLSARHVVLGANRAGIEQGAQFEETVGGAGASSENRSEMRARCRTVLQILINPPG
jgi:hypothetical protein